MKHPILEVNDEPITALDAVQIGHELSPSPARNNNGDRAESPLQVVKKRTTLANQPGSIYESNQSPTAALPKSVDQLFTDDAGGF